MFNAMDITWACIYANSYSGLGHSADPDEINDLEKFLEKTLPSEAAAGL